MSIFLNVILGIILGLDAFSLAVSLGSFNLTVRKCNILIIIIGIFHFIFPILGSLIGQLIHIPITELKIIVFYYLLIEMSLDYFNSKKIVYIDSFINYVIMAFSVSIDSFSIGISMPLQNEILLSCLIFSICSVLFTIGGLKLGNYLNDSIGKKANIIGIFLIIIVLLCQIINP